MDLTLSCTDLNVTAFNYKEINLSLTNVDVDVLLEDHNLIKDIDVETYMDKHENDVDEILSYIDTSEVVDFYTAEELLSYFELDDILNYFEKNLINHV